MKTTIVDDIFKKYLKEKGFRKKARWWNKETEHSVFIINLQKSAYGNGYYVNVVIKDKMCA